MKFLVPNENLSDISTLLSAAGNPNELATNLNATAIDSIDEYPLLRVLRLFDRLLSVHLCFIFTYHAFAIRRTPLIHPNFKILMYGMSIFIGAIGLIRTLIDALNYIEPDYTPAFCLYVANPLHAVACGSTQTTYLFLFLERFYATCRPHGYEHRSAIFAKISVFIYAAIGVGFGSAAILFDSASGPYPLIGGKCLSMERRPLLALANWTVIGLLSAPFIVGLLLVHRYNARRVLEPGRGSLSARYQFNENTTVLSAMMPGFIWCATVFSGIGYLAAGYVFWLIRLAEPVGLRMVVALKILLAANSYVLLFLWRHPALRQFMRKDFMGFIGAKTTPFHIELRGPPLNDAAEADFYFGALARSWK